MSNELSLDNLPSIAKVEFSEEKNAEIRAQAVDLCNQIVHPDNLDGFLTAVSAFFALFNIPSEPSLLQRNQELWTRAYQNMQNKIRNGSHTYVDIEIFGQGTYANIYLKRVELPALLGKLTVMQITPGACSIPRKIEPLAVYRVKVPDRNFFDLCEAVLGVDISQFEYYRDTYREYGVDVTKDQKYKFYAIGKSFVRVPLDENVVDYLSNLVRKRLKKNN